MCLGFAKQSLLHISTRVEFEKDRRTQKSMLRVVGQIEIRVDLMDAHCQLKSEELLNGTTQAKEIRTEKGIRKLCCELLDLKDAVENLCGNMHLKYLAFLMISEEAVEVKHELIDLQKHISAQGILVQDLMTSICHELDKWNQSSKDVDEIKHESELLEPLSNEGNDQKTLFLENIDVLLAEHKFEEALEALDAEKKFCRVESLRE